MSRKKNLSEEEIKEIIHLYQTTLPNKHKLGEKYGVAHRKISQLLTDNDIKTTNNSAGISSDLESSKVNVLKPSNENNKLVAVCKETGKIFNDAMNRSGTLTNHIVDTLSLDVNIPTNTYQRKKYEKLNGSKWYEQYFDLVEEKIDEVRNCPLCEWNTTDVTNKTGCFENHIKDVHNMSLSKYLIAFPNEAHLHSRIEEAEKKKRVLSNPYNAVTCKICGEKMKNITNTHLATHNTTASEYKLKFIDAPLISEKLSNLFSEVRKESNINMKPTWTSSGEIELKEFIEGLGFEVEKSRNRKLLNGSEVDLIIPKIKLGIEYNGLYWHLEKHGKDQKYHLNKTIKCNELGYNLIHLFEDEWITKNILVKEKFKYLLGVSKGIKIGARKCKIKEINPKEKNAFLSEFHIQGNDKSNIYFGAYYGDVIVGVMTFKNKRSMTKNVDEQYELSRFSTNYNYIISGLPSKMLKHMIKIINPKSIISFADRRWTLNGGSNMYTKLGFELVNILKPSYTYYNSSKDRYKRLHKFGFGKSSLKLKYPDLDFNKTEYELAKSLGYDRIWDCGLFKYELNL